MPATHHSSAPPTSSKAKAAGKKTTGRKGATPAGAAGPSSATAGERSSPDAATTVGRIPVLDVRPVVQRGRRPAKAVTGESFEVSATVFREGHDAVAANVVLRDPAGRPGPWTPMRELAPGTDRWGATVTAGEPGHWTYTVEAWSDPLATWRHHARIKIPAIRCRCWWSANGPCSGRGTSSSPARRGPPRSRTARSARPRAG